MHPSIWVDAEQCAFFLPLFKGALYQIWMVYATTWVRCAIRWTNSRTQPSCLWRKDMQNVAIYNIVIVSICSIQSARFLWWELRMQQIAAEPGEAWFETRSRKHNRRLHTSTRICKSFVLARESQRAPSQSVPPSLAQGQATRRPKQLRKCRLK